MTLFDPLPTDEARRILWRFADRDDLQMLVQSVRAAARGPGITSFSPEPGQVGLIEGPKNLAQALVIFELAWADARAAIGVGDPIFGLSIAPAIKAAARLLSAVAPVIRYQRERFRGSSAAGPGTPRYDLGLQMKEDAVHRLLEVWAGGESCASLGFEAARLLDRIGALRPASKDAGDLMEETAMLESIANVLDPACKVWSICHAPRLMREAVGLMGGCGVTADCPGLVGNKWIDSQKEAIDEGAAWRQLGVAMADGLFLTRFRAWIGELQAVATTHPTIGAGTLAIAMEVWLWTFQRLRHRALADTLCGILASRAQILDVATLTEAPQVSAEFLGDLCHVQAANVAGEVGRVCAGLAHGSDDSSGLAFADRQVMLDGSLAGSFAARDRALEALMRAGIPEVRD